MALAFDHAIAPHLFFFQAEDGIRDWPVTGVQTCALPISGAARGAQGAALSRSPVSLEPRRSSRSRAEMTELVLPGHANAVGTIFGGKVMEWIDIAGKIGRASCRERGQQWWGRGRGSREEN